MALSSANLLSLARFAFNIYGSLGPTESPRVPRTPESPARHLSSTKLVYNCEKEITCLSQLNHLLGRLNSAYYDSSAPSHHVIIGGKNYLKLLALNLDQSALVADINLIDPSPSLRFHSSLKLFNVNTIKCTGDMVACGLTSGVVSIYQVSGNGKSRSMYRLDDHKRVINSLDFVDQDQILLSGSQDGTVKLWDLRLYVQKPVLKLLASQHSDPVRSCQYSPHSKVRGKLTVLTVHDSGSLCKFDFRFPTSSNNGMILPERKWTFHTGPALSLHIHPECERVLTGGRDKRICLWNYGEPSLNSGLPETTLNTYGPVVKIRWNNSPNETTDPHPEYSAEDVDPLIYNHDFACLYLNDDPTITVYNLSRKYVPKEVVTTTSHKPIQNFIWAKSFNGDRRLWTITKSNMFVSYNLDSKDGSLQNILRPSEDLPSVATAWSNGFANLSLVSQSVSDYVSSSVPAGEPELDLLEKSFVDERKLEEERFEHHTSPMSIEAPTAFNKASSTHGSLPNPSNLLYQKSQSNLGSKDRQLLIRSASNFPQTKSPSPISHQRSTLSESFAGLGLSMMRPSMGRNPSQSTIDSGSLSPVFIQSHGQHVNPPRRSPSGLPSPYVVSLSVPIPQADDDAFEILASDYYISVPDGCNLALVCQVNGRTAASVQRFRECQVWRIIAVTLEQEDFEKHKMEEPAQEVAVAESTDKDVSGDESQLGKSPDDAKSILSELGNFVGSFNSNSTLTTNYGSGPKRSESNSSVNNLAILGSSKDSSRGAHSFMNLRSPSHHSLVDMVQKATNPNGSKSNNTFRKSLINRSESSLAVDENAIEDDDDNNQDTHIVMARKNSFRSDVWRIGSGVDIRGATLHPMAPYANSNELSPDLLLNDHSPNLTKKSAFLKRRQSLHNLGMSSFRPMNIPGSSQDLDNENLNVLSHAASSYSTSMLAGGDSKYSSTSFAKPRDLFVTKSSPIAATHSLSSRGSFSIPNKGYGVLRHSSSNLLERVNEDSINGAQPKPSGLTRAINESRSAPEEDMSEIMERPWSSIELIKRAIDYAMIQGDLVMCATLILLFYDAYGDQFARKIMNEESCLECLGLYVDTLRQNCMFTVSAKVVKEAPAGLKYKLGLYASKEIDMRFYCCWCQKLLVNAASKAAYGADGEKFGYWYCDECSRKQPNCVYCNEPCRGLTVAVSLKCGHRGHFGCLQEWHLEDGNFECPGGCDEI